MALPNDSQPASLTPGARMAPGPIIRSAYAGDPDMVELIQEFAAEMPIRARELTDMWQRGDRVNLLRMAHQLKGASAGYGFDPLGRVAAALEASLKREDTQLESIRSQLDDLVQMCNRVSA
jgi:HPt (histidine-containing phosphotransfer) domain-containing protein